VLDEGLLPVPGGHQVFFKASGNRRGIPFLFIHGGPGAGSTDRDQLYFNASRDLVVRFDQRGCGQSVPYAGLENNDTWALVDDMEVIRKRLGIERWILFGGSWGTTLAKAYYLKHKAWPGSQRIVVPKAGHSATEPGIRGALVEAVDRHAALWLATHQ
jgi:proline iminopeptidase